MSAIELRVEEPTGSKDSEMLLSPKQDEVIASCKEKEADTTSKENENKAIKNLKRGSSGSFDTTDQIVVCALVLATLITTIWAIETLNASKVAAKDATVQAAIGNQIAFLRLCLNDRKDFAVSGGCIGTFDEICQNFVNSFNYGKLINTLNDPRIIPSARGPPFASSKDYSSGIGYFDMLGIVCSWWFVKTAVAFILGLASVFGVLIFVFAFIEKHLGSSDSGESKTETSEESSKEKPEEGLEEKGKE